MRRERREMLQRNPRAELARPQAGFANKQPRRLLIALVLLLVARAAVLVKDRDLPGVLWVGGCGGHGLAQSFRLGRMAGRWIERSLVGQAARAKEYRDSR